MTYSPLMTKNFSTSQQSARVDKPLNMVILHHAATTSATQVVAMMTSGSREVSAHAVVKDTTKYGVVVEEQRAWSLASQYWDSRAFTVECANESTDGWTISAASHESLAQLTADWARRYGFPIIRSQAVPPTQWTLLGHREVYSIYGDSYATACPGGMNLDWIANRANQILSGKTPPKGTKLLNLYDYSDTVHKTIGKTERIRLLRGNTNAAQNLVGSPSKGYIIGGHVVVGKLAPGDKVEAYFVYSNKGKESNYYRVTGVAGKDGVVGLDLTSYREVKSGDAVFLDVVTDGNQNEGSIISFASNARLFV